MQIKTIQKTIHKKVTEWIDSITDENLRKELIAKGYQRASEFSWERTAKETLAVLEKVGGI